MDFYACAFRDAPPRGRKSHLGESWIFACSRRHFRCQGVCQCQGGIVFVIQSAAFSLSHLSPAAWLVRRLVSGTCDTHAGVVSAGLRGVHAPLPKPSVFFVLAMLRVWEITLLLGPGWLRLMGACSVGARSHHVRLLFSLAHEFFPQTAPILGF